MRVPQEIIVSRISQAGITVMLTKRLARWWTKSLHVLQTQGVPPSDLPSRNVMDHEGAVVVYLTGGAGVGVGGEVGVQRIFGGGSHGYRGELRWGGGQQSSSTEYKGGTVKNCPSIRRAVEYYRAWGGGVR